MNLHSCTSNITQLRRVVNQLMQFIESHPACIESKNEKHTLDEIGLTRTVGSHNRSEILVERPNLLSACIRLEVLQNQVIDNKAGLILFYQH